MKIAYDVRSGTKPEVKENHCLRCPLCGNEDHCIATHRRDRDRNWRWFIHCYAGACQSLEPGEYVREVAAAVGARNGFELLSDPLSFLAPDTSTTDQKRSRSRRQREQAWVPWADVRRWHDKLMDSWSPLEYLHSERGLADQTIRAHAIGYDGSAFTIPVILDHERCLVTNIKRRYWPGPAKDAKGGPLWKRGLARAASLYPDLPPGRSLLLCEGEFDALIARQHGLPAVTSTTGTSWAKRWDSLVKGRRIAVVYDAGDPTFRVAHRRAARLRSAGANEGLAGRTGPKLRCVKRVGSAGCSAPDQQDQQDEQNEEQQDEGLAIHHVPPPSDGRGRGALLWTHMTVPPRGYPGDGRGRAPCPHSANNHAGKQQDAPVSEAQPLRAALQAYI